MVEDIPLLSANYSRFLTFISLFYRMLSMTNPLVITFQERLLLRTIVSFTTFYFEISPDAPGKFAI